jgi:hypothetical protein
MTFELDTKAVLKILNTQKDQIENDFHVTDRGKVIYVKIPKVFEKFPHFPNIKGCEMICDKDILRIFGIENIQDIVQINGELRDCDGAMICEKCKEDDIGFTNSIYHCYYWESPTNREDVVMDYSLCMDCAKKWPEIIKKYNMIIIHSHNNNMGSIFSWIPIYKDKEYNQILYCAVKSETHYGKYALLSYDNHGRSGMFVINSNIDEIKKELELTYKDDRENTWEDFFNAPIKQALYKRDHEVQYG